MALRMKPTQETPTTEDDRRINALIEKGGTVATEKADAKPSLVQLRLMPAIIERIDAKRNQRRVPPSRHSWILEALLEKLDTE